MKVNALKFLAILAIAGLSSCTTYIYIPKLYPPEIIPETKPLTVVFINNYNYHDTGIVNEKYHRTYERAVSGFTKGLSGSMSSDDSLKLIIGDTLRNETGAGMLTTLLPIETIAENCKKYNAGMLIALDSVNIGYNSQTQYEESVSFINLYSRSFYLYTEFFLSVYNPAGDLINRCSVDRSYYYSWRMALTESVAFDPSITKAVRKIDNVSVPCGADFAAKFYPMTENLSRQVYTGDTFKESNNLMLSGQWEEAVKKLEVLCQSPDKNTARKARINLDVAKEGARR